MRCSRGERLLKSYSKGKDEGRQGLLALNDRPYRGDFLIQNVKEMVLKHTCAMIKHKI